MISREIRWTRDLFLGVLIDCSGSMAYADHSRKAKLFGVLVAEACRGLRGIDARFFGFTDSTIYEVGTAERCAVTSLTVGGGNNDAAALLHASAVAAQSRRKARLLVMISDGAPTECSTTALSALVQRLGKRNIICAQVAVCPIEVQCFSDYVELTDDLDAAVRQFGSVVGRLVVKALGR